MSTAYIPSHDRIGRTYEALRCDGSPPWRAQAEMGLAPAEAGVLEARFLRRPPREVRPRFARCAAHVRAVKALGGFPVLP